MTDLYQLDARALVAKLKSGEVAPTEAVEAAFHRIAEVEEKRSRAPDALPRPGP